MIFSRVDVIFPNPNIGYWFGPRFANPKIKIVGVFLISLISTWLFWENGGGSLLVVPTLPGVISSLSNIGLMVV